MRKIVIALAGVFVFAGSALHAQSPLKGSRTAMRKQNTIAQKQDYTFLRTSSDVRRFVSSGYLVPVKGTVLGDMFAGERMIDDIEFVRTVAVARITMPRSMVRLSAGRESMSESTQALCFLAGANSIFTGDKLLTTANAGDSADAAMLAKLGLKPMEAEEPMRADSHPEPVSASTREKFGAAGMQAAPL